MSTTSYLPSPDRSVSNGPFVGVIGVGYVGLHLVQTFSKEFITIGYDISTSRIEDLKARYADEENMRFTSASKELVKCDLFCVSVPTLIDEKNGQVDTSYVEKVSELLEKVAKKGCTIVMVSFIFSFRFCYYVYLLAFFAFIYLHKKTYIGIFSQCRSNSFFIRTF